MKISTLLILALLSACSSAPKIKTQVEGNHITFHSSPPFMLNIDKRFFYVSSEDKKSTYQWGAVQKFGDPRLRSKSNLKPYIDVNSNKKIGYDDRSLSIGTVELLKYRWVRNAFGEFGFFPLSFKIDNKKFHYKIELTENDLKLGKNKCSLDKYYFSIDKYDSAVGYTFLYREKFNCKDLEDIAIVSIINPKIKSFSNRANEAIGYYKMYNNYVTVDKLLAGAKNGDMNLQFKVAEIYEEGSAYPKSYNKAVEWFQKSAKQGHKMAQFNVDLFNSKDYAPAANSLKTYPWNNIANDKNKAKEFYKKGLNHEIGNTYDQNIVIAIEWYKKAAELGDLEALFALGNMHERGKHFDKSISEAIYYYSLAANSGSISAQVRMAELYEHGIDVKQDLKKALYWYKQASHTSGTAKNAIRWLCQDHPKLCTG